MTRAAAPVAAWTPAELCTRGTTSCGRAAVSCCHRVSERLRQKVRKAAVTSAHFQHPDRTTLGRKRCCPSPDAGQERECVGRLADVQCCWGMQLGCGSIALPASAVQAQAHEPSSGTGACMECNRRLGGLRCNHLMYRARWSMSSEVKTSYWRSGGATCSSPLTKAFQQLQAAQPQRRLPSGPTYTRAQSRVLVRYPGA